MGVSFYIKHLIIHVRAWVWRDSSVGKILIQMGRLNFCIPGIHIKKDLGKHDGPSVVPECGRQRRDISGRS